MRTYNVKQEEIKMAKKATKTDINKMLKGIRGVNVENFSTYLQQTGVVVEPHVGRLRRRFALPKEVLGIKCKDNDFYADYVNGGSFSLLTKSDENSLSSIESAVRHAVKRYAIGFDGKYMPIEIYKDEYLPYFKGKQENYFKKRDEIAAKWDETVGMFKNKLEEFLENNAELTDEEMQTVKANIYTSIPTKEQFVDSFYMNVSLSAFPVPANLSLLDESISDEIKDSIARNSVETLYEVLGNLMNDAFKSINGIISYYNEKGCISRKFKSVTNELVKRLQKNNILKHVLIDEIIQDVKNLNEEDDEDDIVEKCELIMSKIYGFALETKTDNYIDFSNSQLNVGAMYTIYTSL